MARSKDKRQVPKVGRLDSSMPVASKEHRAVEQACVCQSPVMPPLTIMIKGSSRCTQQLAWSTASRRFRGSC